MSESPAVFALLANALKERLTLIADRAFFQRDPAAHLEQLQAVSSKITTFAAQLPPNTDPQLAHYLQRCSYDKALAFIDDRQPPLVAKLN